MFDTIELFKYHCISRLFYILDSAEILERWVLLNDVPVIVARTMHEACTGFFKYITLSTIESEIIIEYSILASLDMCISYSLLSLESSIYGSVEKAFNRIDYDKLVEEHRAVWIASTAIQRCWRRAIANPEYAVCRKRLMNEFKNIMN